MSGINPLDLLSGHINDTWWISWLLNGKHDDAGNDIPLAEGVYFVSSNFHLNIEMLFIVCLSAICMSVYCFEV